ncbi:MAG TPA: AarF/ABC1/UbiB kinase family protein, partial [Bacteroidetes bacterium]|nr:AarF/ABC1/UbiB kinase family protein [Bacteroidota bacterium]
FAKLQDEVAPIPFEELKPYIENEYSATLQEIFQDFEEEPEAAASMAQVYRARLKSGENVAVKVLRPNIQKTIDTDLEILFNLAELIEKYIPESKLYNPTGIVKEFSRTIKREQNFVIEGRYIDIFRRHFFDDETIKIPYVYWKYTTPRILIVEYIKGIKITDIEQYAKSDIDPKQVAINGARALMKQIFEFGIFHADPHPGNIFVLPGNVLVLVDFGMVGRVDEEMKMYLLELAKGIINKDVYRITRVLLNIGMVEEQINVRQLRRDLLDYLDRYYGVPLGQLNTTQLMNEFMELVRNYQIKLPSDMVMMGRAISLSESLGRQLCPDFNILELLVPYTRRLLFHRWNPTYHYRNFNRMIETGYDLFRSLPEDIHNIILKFKKDRITVRFFHQGLEHLTRELDRSSNRIAFSLIIAALIIGSSMVIQLNKGPFLWGYPAIGIIGYVLATVLGFWLIIAILRSGKL